VIGHLGGQIFRGDGQRWEEVSQRAAFDDPVAILHRLRRIAAKQCLIAARADASEAGVIHTAFIDILR
jgi:hypothetical protein